MSPSPYSSAVPNTPSVTTTAAFWVILPRGMIIAVSAKMPPSPWLSARITNIRYLTEMIMTSAQNTTDATPRAFTGLVASR